MSETTSTEKQTSYFGTYFDRDSILRLSRWADIVAWVILTIYIVSWLSYMLMTLSQYYNGMFMEKGMTFLNAINYFAPQLQQPLPGIFYFFGLQAVSKGMLILLDMEDNTRRAAKK
jgi:hypothetical protein